MKTQPRILAAAFAATLALLGFTEARKHVPYRDVGGVLTVCKGVTGPEVVEGRWYSNDECQALEEGALRKIWAKVEPCVTVDLSLTQIIALQHFAYNVGSGAVCSSTLLRRLNAGDRHGACAAITTQWRYVKKRDCFDPKNKCMGLKDRRELEEALCADRPTAMVGEASNGRVRLLAAADPRRSVRVRSIPRGQRLAPGLRSPRALVA